MADNPTTFLVSNYGIPYTLSIRLTVNPGTTQDTLARTDLRYLNWSYQKLKVKASSRVIR